MSNNHIPGRLSVGADFDNDGTPETIIQGSNQEACVAVALDFGKNNPGLRAANARRIVACWNACAGFYTELLENIDMVGDTLKQRFEGMQAEVRRVDSEAKELRKENEQLRELLCLRSASPTHLPYMDDGELQDGSAIPFIDWKRDSIDTIKAKLKDRTLRALKGGAA